MARLNNGLTPGENGRIVASIITEDDLEELQKLHSELLARVDQARTDGRLFMMGHYVRLVALISPEIDRVERRFKAHFQRSCYQGQDSNITGNTVLIK